MCTTHVIRCGQILFCPVVCSRPVLHPENGAIHMLRLASAADGIVCHALAQPAEHFEVRVFIGSRGQTFYILEMRQSQILIVRHQCYAAEIVMGLFGCRLIVSGLVRLIPRQDVRELTLGGFPLAPACECPSVEGVEK